MDFPRQIDSKVVEIREEKWWLTLGFYNLEFSCYKNPEYCQVDVVGHT